MNQDSARGIAYSSPEGFYSLTYPDNWKCCSDDACTAFYRSDDGIGALQISAYEAPEPQAALENLLEYLDDEKLETKTQSRVSEHGHEIAECVFKRTDFVTKVWFMTKDVYLVFITFTYDPPVPTEEAREMESIVNSIQIGPNTKRLRSVD